MAGGFRSVVPGPVDVRGRGDVLVDAVFGARGRRRALVGDEPGERSAVLAFDLRVDAPLRRGRADDRVGLIMAELAARVHAFGTSGDGRAHRDARPLRSPAPGARAVPFASRRVPPEARRLPRFRVDSLVEALVADAHARVGRPFGLQPAFDRLGRPSLAQGVHDPCEQRRIRHAPGLSRLAVDLSRPILRAIWRTPSPSRLRNSSIRTRSSADRREYTFLMGATPSPVRT